MISETRSILYVSRVSNQNGVSQAWHIVKIHHSGRKPSISNTDYTWTWACSETQWKLRKHFMNSSTRNKTPHIYTQYHSLFYIYFFNCSHSCLCSSLHLITMDHSASNCVNQWAPNCKIAAFVISEGYIRAMFCLRLHTERVSKPQRNSSLLPDPFAPCLQATGLTLPDLYTSATSCCLESTCPWSVYLCTTRDQLLYY